MLTHFSTIDKRRKRAARKTDTMGIKESQMIEIPCNVLQPMYRDTKEIPCSGVS